MEAKRSKTNFDEVIFDTYEMQVFQKGIKRYTQILFEKKYENDEILLINIVVQEEDKLREFFDALSNSKFGRKI